MHISLVIHCFSLQAVTAYASRNKNPQAAVAIESTLRQVLVLMASPQQPAFMFNATQPHAPPVQPQPTAAPFGQRSSDDAGYATMTTPARSGITPPPGLPPQTTNARADLYPPVLNPVAAFNGLTTLQPTAPPAGFPNTQRVQFDARGIYGNPTQISPPHQQQGPRTEANVHIHAFGSNDPSMAASRFPATASGGFSPDNSGGAMQFDQQQSGVAYGGGFNQGFGMSDLSRRQSGLNFSVASSIVQTSALFISAEPNMNNVDYIQAQFHGCQVKAIRELDGVRVEATQTTAPDIRRSIEATADRGFIVVGGASLQVARDTHVPMHAFSHDATVDAQAVAASLSPFGKIHGLHQGRCSFAFTIDFATAQTLVARGVVFTQDGRQIQLAATAQFFYMLSPDNVDFTSVVEHLAHKNTDLDVKSDQIVRLAADDQIRGHASISRIIVCQLTLSNRVNQQRSLPIDGRRVQFFETAAEAIAATHITRGEASSAEPVVMHRTDSSKYALAPKWDIPKPREFRIPNGSVTAGKGYQQPPARASSQHVNGGSSTAVLLPSIRPSAGEPAASADAVCRCCCFHLLAHIDISLFMGTVQRRRIRASGTHMP